MRNTINAMFEIATKSKFRYPYKGMITTEDLWDLDINQLDIVYRNLNRDLMAIDGESLIASRSADEGVKANDIKNKIEVVRYIFNYKQQAAELARVSVENAKKRQVIMEALAQKQNTALQNMSEEDLKKMLEDLG